MASAAIGDALRCGRVKMLRRPFDSAHPHGQDWEHCGIAGGGRGEGEMAPVTHTADTETMDAAATLCMDGARSQSELQVCAELQDSHAGFLLKRGVDGEGQRGAFGV